jgi:hypothetical protein
LPSLAPTRLLTSSQPAASTAMRLSPNQPSLSSWMQVCEIRG